MEDLGLDARSLGISEKFRPWHDAGLRLVFRDAFPAAQCAAEAPASSVAPASAAQPVPHVSRETAKKSFHRPPKVQRAHHDNSQLKPGQVPQFLKNKEPRKPAPRPAPPQDGGPLFPWDEFRKRLHVPSRTVWTYWELGDDFGPTPSAERRQLFSNIIHHLKWPAGTITFWPLSAQHNGFLLPHPGNFWKGVREAQARTVFCFGNKAFQALFPGHEFSVSRRMKGGVEIFVLPGPGTMLAGNKADKCIVWNALSQYAHS